MITKAEIIVEKFDEGITLRWSEPNGTEQKKKSLASNGREHIVIGAEVWSDLQSIFEEKHSERVKMSIEYDCI
jgi:hypothetical protein